MSGCPVIPDVIGDPVSFPVIPDVIGDPGFGLSELTFHD